MLFECACLHPESLKQQQCYVRREICHYVIDDIIMCFIKNALSYYT